MIPEVSDRTEIKPKATKNSNGFKIPPLENGDRLTRAEFERRYEQMPNVKAELIEGVVFMSSPVRVKNHGEPHSRIMGWIFMYSALTKGTNFTDNSTLKLDMDNEYQPDAALYIEESRGGNSWVSASDYLEGAPELIVEIAGSSKSYDLHDKKKVYRRIGVQEYIVWRIYDKEIDWFSLENDEYILLSPDANGVVESRVFAGLQLNIKALLADDLTQVLADLQTGLDSEKHTEFVRKLQSKVKN